MSRTDFINKFSSEKITLAHVHGSTRLFTWALDSGSVYKRSVPYFVYSLKQGTTELTAVSSVGAVSEGTYFYDSVAGELYVHTNGSTNPQTAEEMIVTYRLFYSSAPVTCSWDLTDTGKHVHYEGRIQLAPPYKHKIAVEQNLVSIIGNGSLKLINTDGALDDVYDALIFDNHEIRIYSWNRNLAFSDARIIYRGRVTNKRFQPDNVAFLVKDMLFDLDQIIPQDVYDDTDTVTNDVKGTRKRWLYGRVDGLKLQSISQIGEGYQLTGTVSMNVNSQALLGVGTAFLSECSPDDTITIGTLEFKIESIQSDTELTLDDAPEYAQNGVVATLNPEIPTVVKNREFFVAGHATAKLTKQVVNVIQLNRIVLSDVDGIQSGDFLEFDGGERLEVQTLAPGNVIVLRQNIINKPGVGTDVIRQPLQQIFVKSDVIQSTKYAITNNSTETKVTLDSDVEFTLARNKSLNVDFTFTNGSRVATTTDDVDLTEIIEPRDFIRPTDVLYSTYYEVLSVGEGRVLTGTVTTDKLNGLMTGSGTAFKSELRGGDTVKIGGIDVDIKGVGVQLTGTVDGNSASTTINGTGTLFTTELSPSDEIEINGERYIVNTITNNILMNLTANPVETFSGEEYFKPNDTNAVLDDSKSQETGTVSGSTSSATINGFGTLFTTEYSNGDTIEINDVRYTVLTVINDTLLTLSSIPTVGFSGADHYNVDLGNADLENDLSGLSIRLADEKAIELRTVFSDPTHTGPTEGKLPDYIGDDTIVSANVLGRTVDGEPDGTWITTAAQAMRDLISVAGITEVNETSFTEGATENSQLISIALPLTPSASGITYKQVIDRLAKSTTSVVTLDNDLKLKYKVVGPQINDDPVIISDFDVQDWNIETVNGKNIRNTVVRYRFKDIDRYTQESGQLSKSYTNEFVEKYVGTNKTEELDVYLYNDIDAEIMTHRNTYLHSLGRADIKVTTDLRYEDLEIGDTIILNFRRLYKRFGDSSSRQKAVMVVGKNLNGERTQLELSDLGNIFNRSSIITPNTAPDYSGATELEKIKYGYITENNGIVDDDEDTSNVHLIS